MGKYIIIGISAVMIFSVNSNFLVWAAFAACMVIFVFPLFLLGTVTPSLVKYTVDDLEDSGKTVGMLNASNTIGSIIGTFVPTFITIPAVGTSITFLIFSGILLILSIIYFLSSKIKSTKAVVGAIVLVIACFLGNSDSFAFWEDDLTYEGESVYNYLQVKENEKEVYLSRAALTADEIAKEAEFFSFGTNDLTQMTFGFSRDDAGKFLDSYYDAKIYENDPFAKLDQTGVGQLMEMAVKNGKATRPEIHCGICGEHGGDPTSVEFCHKIGLDYVSCSPFRVPIARLAAAQAAIASMED